MEGSPSICCFRDRSSLRCEKTGIAGNFSSVGRPMNKIVEGSYGKNLGGKYALCG